MIPSSTLIAAAIAACLLQTVRLPAQSAAATEGSDPVQIPASGWTVIDTTRSGGIREAALADLIEEGGFRFVWVRILRPTEENNGFIFFARTGLDCRRRRQALFRN